MDNPEEPTGWSQVEASAFSAAYYAWRDAMWQLGDSDEETRPRDWHKWRNMIVTIEVDELDKWCVMAERLTDWSSVMELARND